ncbi:hypothetical protein HDU92_001773 [Lobulomyces angularis]|nr:hypothetical protein HDU92_001773 [Lobulomyces angularis]
MLITNILTNLRNHLRIHLQKANYLKQLRGYGLSKEEADCMMECEENYEEKFTPKVLHYDIKVEDDKDYADYISHLISCT